MASYVGHIDHARQRPLKMYEQDPTIHGQVTTQYKCQRRWYILPFIPHLKKNKPCHHACPSLSNIPLDSRRNPHPPLSLLASTFTPKFFNLKRKAYNHAYYYVACDINKSRLPMNHTKNLYTSISEDDTHVNQYSTTSLNVQHQPKIINRQ